MVRFRSETAAIDLCSVRLKKMATSKPPITNIKNSKRKGPNSDEDMSSFFLEFKYRDFLDIRC